MKFRPLNWLMATVAVILLFGVCIAGAPGLASAGMITSRAALAGNDFYDWGQLGPNGTFVGVPVGVTSNLGRPAQLTSGGSQIERVDQPVGWGGNFAPGDRAIWNLRNNGSIQLIFNSPVAGAGAQIQDDLPEAFTATLFTFDSLGNLLNSYVENGNSTNGNDNSAIFLGALDSTADIGSVASLSRT